MASAALLLLFVPVAVFLGYPALVIAAAAFVRPRSGAAGPRAADAPPVAILICAHNEAARIGEKLASVLDAVAAYPGPAQVIVADDASSDDTAAIVAGFPVRLVRCPRGGKAAALNRIAPLADADILVMTDADPLFAADTLPALLAPFADARVGAVAGRVETIRAGGRRDRFGAADRLFRRYESALRAAEDRLFGCVSADGGLYAIRRALMPAVPADVTDDFFISTAAVAAGQRIAFADDARVWEHSIARDRQQFRRRVRITVRGLTALWRRRALMNPQRTGAYAAALVFHKLFRRLAPLALLPAWVLAGLLARGGSPAWAIVFVALGGLFALAGAVALTGWRLPGALRPLHGAALHLAGLAAGTLLFASGRRYAQWTPQKDAA